jgi:uncharacterized cupin superfamily protein
MTASRRSFCAGSIPAFLALAECLQATEAQAELGQSLQSFTEPFEDMKAQTHGSSTYRSICDGITAVGARVEVHETQLNPGAEPHPPHRHKHEEFILIVKGRILVDIDGKSATLTPGSAIFWKTMALHHMRNIGDDVAQYFVVSIGTDT